ncbi:PTS sugar transporter subunit IIA [Paramicrobacterium chengjingii]|uniref:PTS sugar transporter subunit IIA n=1 Tax=Paramicrobacterium chengjingii TaxID=2769067 RepID=UPI001FD3D83D|nr:PTS sugar transporter subunit IIA [Microbacterium chengjingii]
MSRGSVVEVSAPSVISVDLISLDHSPPASKEELFAQMVRQLAEAGRIDDQAEAVTALQAREAMGSTYMGNGIAIPHAKSPTFATPSVSAWRFKEPMRYRSFNEEGDVSRVFMLTMPDGADREHLKVLAEIARMLSHDEVLADFDAAHSGATVATLLSEYLANDSESTQIQEEK